MLLVPSKLPNSDYVINPYIGCAFGCKYCYAKFMAKFVSGKHGLPNDVKSLQKTWGTWLVPKINDVNNFNQELKIKLNKIKGKTILLSSVTDPYNPSEAKYKLTRTILKTWIKFNPNAKLEILTRSAMILRDLEILKQIKNFTVGISISVLPKPLFRKLEPKSPDIKTRIKIITLLKDAGINVYAFIAPVWPRQLQDLKSIVNKLKRFNIHIRYIELLNKMERRQYKTDFSNAELLEIKNMAKQLGSFCILH